MAYTLFITEKPSAAKAIAMALSDTKPVRIGEKAVWYEFNSNGKKCVTAPAVGHLFTLKQTDKGWAYPNFNVEWVPSYKANKFAAFSEPYFKNMESLAKDASDVVVATDYDDEGEVIGYNILRFVFKKENAKRMKFSTMTKEEIIDSFKNQIKLDKSLVDAGLARHYLDWYYGINLTRALTLSIKNAAKRFRILSTGRVQGPTLHMLAKHEKKIKAFVPKPFWDISVDVQLGKGTVTAEYAKGKIWNEKEADKIASKIGKNATVKSVSKKIITQKPPRPYNTTSFLADIYRYFGYAPQQGLSIAESLYQSGLISYPRTSSEKLPKDIGYQKIIKSISKQAKYMKDANKLLQKKELKPEEGAKTDLAHPAIYPTGEMPKKIGEKQQKVYDLVVRRFFAVFGDPAKRESNKVVLDSGDELFVLSGRNTIEAGWTELYGRYAAREDIILPDIKIGDVFSIKDSKLEAKKTTPPPRFSQGSVLKEMEAKNLGTKATRAQILQILYNRGYLVGRSIEVTDLGMQLSNILEKNVPDVVSEKLTGYFEEMTDSIQTGKTKKETVLAEAKKELIKISETFRKKEKKIGEELTKAVIQTQDKQSMLGACLKCSGTLRIQKSWRTKKRFVGCSGYSKGCRVGFPLPREGLIINTEKTCETCKMPIIQVQVQGKRPFRMCLDPLCETKKEWLDKKKLKAAQIESREGSKAVIKCEKCGKFLVSKRAYSLHTKKHKISA